MNASLLQTLLHVCGLDERRCASCHMPYPTSFESRLALCPKCRAEVRFTRPLCRRCGVVLGGASVPGSAICGVCLIKPPPWSRMHAAGLHEGLLRELLLRAKFRADRSLCRVLGGLLAERLCEDGDTQAEVILPMPLHPSRLRRRGFNQCHELAEPVSRQLRIPRLPTLARRLVATRPQTGLHREERLRNVRGAFAADSAVLGRKILLLDDTMTTGTTLRRLTECLLAAGAAEVEVAVIAVAVLHAPVH